MSETAHLNVSLNIPFIRTVTLHFLIILKAQNNCKWGQTGSARQSEKHKKYRGFHKTASSFFIWKNEINIWTNQQKCDTWSRPELACSYWNIWMDKASISQYFSQPLRGSYIYTICSTIWISNLSCGTNYIFSLPCNLPSFFVFFSVILFLLYFHCTVVCRNIGDESNESRQF